MMEISIGRLFLAKGIEKPFAWLRKQGISHNMAQRILHGKTKSLPLAVIDTICLKLYCTPNDLIIWGPNENEPDVLYHPLQALKPKMYSNPVDRIKTLSVDELNEITEKLDEMSRRKTIPPPAT